MTLDPNARPLVRSAAILMLVGLLTGVLVSAAMTGKIPADPHAMLASHLNALLGALWMVAVAWSLPLTRLGERGRARLAWGVSAANYANWFITLVKAFLKVSGVDVIGEPVNDAVFGALTLSVVLPSLAVAGAWVWGLSGAREQA
jgi:hydroxylaminobenzene mutase